MPTSDRFMHWQLFVSMGAYAKGTVCLNHSYILWDKKHMEMGG